MGGRFWGAADFDRDQHCHYIYRAALHISMHIIGDVRNNYGLNAGRMTGGSAGGATRRPAPIESVVDL